MRFYTCIVLHTTVLPLFPRLERLGFCYTGHLQLRNTSIDLILLLPQLQQVLHADVRECLIDLRIVRRKAQGER
jgi:hypothetical protein